VSGETIWIASYPKSGNTWLRAVLTAWLTGAPVEINEIGASPIAASRVDFDRLLGIKSSDLTHAEIDLLRPRVDELFVAELQGPRLRKAHDGLYPGPSGEPVISAGATRSVVYMVRDPRDVVVSLAHHRAWTLEHAVDVMNDPAATLSGDQRGLQEQLHQRLGTWSQHVISWTREAPFPVHVIRYEDCLEDPVTSFGAALRFTGMKSVDDGEVATAVQYADFQRLREAEEKTGFRERPVVLERFFRSGVAGSWREVLPGALARRIGEDHAAVMAQLGYR
jgi:hypothetical protein